MQTPEIHVAIDIGSTVHRAAIAGPDGTILDEFDIAHSPTGFRDFFKRIAHHERQMGLPVCVAMEGFNGHARPLDTQILGHGYPLFNVNNLKLSRFKEVFPGPAKSDPIDAHKMLELFRLREQLPLAKDVLQEIVPTPPENAELKRLTRRRRQLVNEKVRLLNRIQSDLQAVAPGLLEITGDADNLWFLRFLTCRNDLAKLAGLQRKSLLKVKGIGKSYADAIQQWQQQAQFAVDVAWVGDMIIEDAQRILALRNRIGELNRKIEVLNGKSAVARCIQSIPGFGSICSGELAGEIGALDRFTCESSLALYLGMAVLDNSSGKSRRVKTPRQVNTHAKAAMMTAVARHVSQVPSSKAYYDKKRAEGKKHNQAIRSLGRHLTRVIWSLIKQHRTYEIR